MRKQHDTAAPGEGKTDAPQPEKIARKPYVKPRIEDTEPFEKVTLFSGGANPTTANPFVQ